MRRKFIALGIISPLFLALFIFACLVIGALVWFTFQTDDPNQISRRNPIIKFLDPLPQETAPDPATDSNPNNPSATSPEDAPEVGAETVAEAAPSPTPDIESALGFALPPDTVNSVTHEGVATRMVIPTMGLDAPIVLAPIKGQTWDVGHLGQAVGHLEGTAPPGSNSNFVLAGHVTLTADVYGPFAGLAQLSAGDLVMVYQGDQQFQYIIDDYETVERTAVEVTHPTDTGQITLITCSNWNKDANRYEQRIIVTGHLLED